MQADKYPFAKEFITDTEGNIRKVVIDFSDYQRIVEAIEDKVLILAMKEVEGEERLSKEEALKYLASLETEDM
ncbi:hypothetical protein IQ247_14425 [Plectonema cf. radiosum LEGE 06105]|uniref:Uncharacterized protein n=1 Tax=Plectonema cf. radiosum LEGE 06105 TaxID=945769 RepID=A0A8J7F0R2_9CYAN|nr:hypothetical protein [Plectonema radiosum]MBE9213846.1 hypothetical protein [Plectonema cf. radiosum LEGE 06105]